MKFTKMHGLGNDYVYVNGFAETVGVTTRLPRMDRRNRSDLIPDGFGPRCPKTT